LLLTEEFSLSIAQMSLVITASGILFGLGAMPFGALSDRIGPARVHLIGIAISCAACAGMYVSASAYQLAGSLLLLGIGASTYHPAAFKLISCNFRDSVGRAFGLNGIIGNVGQIGSPVLSAYIAYTAGWRYVFVALIAVGVAVFVAMWTVRSVDGTVQYEKRKQGITLTRTVVLLLAITMLGGLSYRGMTTMLPAYATLTFGKNTFEAGGMVTVLLAAGGISQVLAGEIHDRWGAAKPMVATSILALASIAIVIAGDYAMVLFGLVMFGFSYFAINLYTNSLVGRLTPEGQRGTYYGLMFFARFGLGFIAPSIIGIVTDAYSIAYLFHIVGVFVFLYALLAILLLRSSGAHVPCCQDAR
jgi:MFS family permease